MIDVKSFDIISPGYNQELIDAIEKGWIKSTATTKEQKEKNLNEIFHVYLDKLNKTLRENESADISDLIMEKSMYMTEVTGVYDWPRPETLKVAEFHRLTIFLYNYSKHRISFQAGHYNNVKDLSYKAFENLSKFLELLMEMLSFELSEDLLFCIYNDIFSFYVKARELSQTEDMKNKVKEDLEMIIQMVYEETNIKSLVKMNTIDKTAERSFFVGVLTLILEFKINQYEKNEEQANEVKSSLDTAYKHIRLLREISTCVFLEYTLIRSAYLFANMDLSVIKDLLDAYKNFKTYRKFRKSSALNKFFRSYENSCKYLLLLNFILLGIKIDSNILRFLNITDDNLVSLNLQNLIIIESLIKSNNFEYLEEMRLGCSILKNLNSIIEKTEKTFLEQKDKEDILERIYENDSFYKMNNKDVLKISFSFNSMFKDMRKSIDSVK